MWTRYSMDLVAGYGSDSSGGSPPASAEPTPAPAVAPALPSWASARETASSEGLLTSLPAPSDQPKRKKRKTLPMTLQYVPDSDEEVSRYNPASEACTTALANAQATPMTLCRTNQTRKSESAAKGKA